MTAALTIPSEHHTFTGRGDLALTVAISDAGRDRGTGVRSGQPGDAGARMDQDLFGNLRHELTIHWKVQQR